MKPQILGVPGVYMKHARESKGKPGGPGGLKRPPTVPSGRPRGRPKKVENKGSDRAQRRNVTH